MSRPEALHSNFSTNEKLRLSQVLLYAVLLAPVSLTIAGDGVSANYLFALLLIAPLGYRVNRDATLYVLFMVISFLLGALIFSGFDGDFLLRQIVSFGLALIGVLVLFVRLRVRLEEFLTSVVVVSLLYSVFAIWMVATKGFSLTDIYFIKGGLREYVTDWPQRYVVVLVFAFFVALARWVRGLVWQFSSLAFLVCIFLTFTRSAWLAVFVGAIAYFMFDRRPQHLIGQPHKRSRVYLLIGSVLFLGLIIYAVSNDLVYKAFFSIFDNLLLTAQSNSADFDPDGSEGARLNLWSSIFGVLGTNPFSGTGFAGVSLVIEGAGSAHSQYLDVLLRTGTVGLLFYLWFWNKLFQFYKRFDRGVLAGLVAMFVFGFFNETTKLSYGALIFFVLLNKAYVDARFRRKLPRYKELTVERPCAAS
jgi:O-antigen ligase